MDLQSALRTRAFLDRHRSQLPRMGEVPAILIGFGANPETMAAARYFAEVHAVENTQSGYVSAQSLAESYPNLKARVDQTLELTEFPDGYAYFIEVAPAVLQKDHTHTHDCVRACARVLACGGLLRMQISSSFAAQTEIVDLTRRFQLQALWFEGPDRNGNYHGLWRRMRMNWREELATLAGITAVDIRKISNIERSVPIVPARGVNISVAVYVSGLPEEADVFDLALVVGGIRASIVSVSPADSKGVKQIIADLPEIDETGLVRVELYWMQERMGRPGVLRVVPRVPEVPRMMSLQPPSAYGTMSAMVEDLFNPEDFGVRVNDKPAWGYEYRCLDEKRRRFEIQFQLPDGVDGGECFITVRLGRRELPPVTMQLAAPNPALADLPEFSFVS